MALLDKIVGGVKDFVDKYLGGGSKSGGSDRDRGGGGSSSSKSSGKLTGDPTIDRYLRELGRAQRAYYEYNDPRLKEGAHNYANRLRAEAAAQGIDLSKYGVRNQYGIDYRQYYTDPGPAGKYQDNSKAPDWLNLGTPVGGDYDTQRRSGGGGGGGGGGNIYDLLNNYYSSYQNSLNRSLEGLDELAAQRANAYINSQLMAYRSAIPMLERQRENAINRILSNLESSKKALDDEYFQRYLQSRQALANRGLNAGFESDMNTRLGLAKMGEIGELQRQASQSQADAELQYAAQIAQIQDRIASIQAQAPMLEAQYLAEMQAAARQQALQEYQAQMDALKFAAPYMFMTAGDQARLAYDMQKDVNDALLQRYLHDTPSGNTLANLQWQQYMFNNVSAADQARMMLQRYMFDNVSGNAALNANTQLQIAQMNNAVRLQIAQANNTLRAYLATRDETKPVPPEVVEAYGATIDPTGATNENGQPDTRQSVQRDLQEKLLNKYITPQEYRAFMEEADRVFDQWEAQQKLKQEQEAKNRAQRRQQIQDTIVNWTPLFPTGLPILPFR